MKVTVVGGGKVGYYLVKTLIEHGHEPTIVEKDKDTCHFIANDLDIPIICGDGTTIESLEAANLRGADAIVCVTGKDENNLIACQLAKKLYNIPKTIAKVNNPKNSAALKQLGVDIVLNSTDNIARLLEHEVDAAAIRQLIALDHGQGSISEIQLPNNYVLDGVLIRDLKLPEQCNIVSITRDDRLIIPRGNTPLKSGDKLLLVALNTTLHEICRAVKMKE